MRSGAEKLRALIGETLNDEPDRASANPFTNKTPRRLMVYCLDRTGERTLQKRFDKGAIVFPAPTADGRQRPMFKTAMDELVATAVRPR